MCSMKTHFNFPFCQNFLLIKLFASCFYALNLKYSKNLSFFFEKEKDIEFIGSFYVCLTYEDVTHCIYLLHYPKHEGGCVQCMS